MIEEDLERIKEPIKYFMSYGIMQTGHTPSNKRTVFMRVNNRLFCFSLINPNKTIASFKVTKWK